MRCSRGCRKGARPASSEGGKPPDSLLPPRHPSPLPSFMPVDSLSPSARYHEGVAAHRWEADPAQLAVLPEFDRMHAALCAPPDNGSLFGRLKSLFGDDARAPVPGLYLWGSVGRGKTFLM